MLLKNLPAVVTVSHLSHSKENLSFVLQSSDLHWAMFSALVGNRPQFVSLLQENGVSLRDFLQDEETLCALYSQLPSCFFLGKLAKRVKSAGHNKKKGLALTARGNARQCERICLTHVSDEVHHLLGKFTKPIYPPSSNTCQVNMFKMDMSVSVRKIFFFYLDSVAFYNIFTV